MKLNENYFHPEKSSFLFKKYAQNVGSIKGLFIKFNDTPGTICNINGIKITHGQEIVKYKMS
jgi:hypothetical protein